MTAQPIEEEFSKYWSRLNPVEKESLLIVAKNYIHLKDEMQPISISQYNEEIDEAMQSIDNGEFYTHDQVESISKSWLHGK